ncbi:translation initiation factor IF-2 [Gloeomargarita lithophora Alchichica-D10]|uniref:Translation initiation factor IF-2 n=1 Tax=Gloeomargarita lithophora Alchichica-D10 TaxID=1188229 RepID=A0A1J0AD22_9CYAN|nr:translation initiation factor IF-2 [Gloeomargarita lithophora]APB33836.1 translation initiation factor IF-2 [Gloeomargarita lithophora Alchichica-D10]
MSNDRVRIYDLSRDLNLDNKSVLELCDRLNVSYKTCSSTITEDEADRIRQAAQNRPSTPRPIPRAEARPSTPAPKPKEAPAPKNKELQIRSYTYRQSEEEEALPSLEAPLRREAPRPSQPAARPLRPELRPQRPTLRPADAPVQRPATPTSPTTIPRRPAVALPSEPAVPALKAPRSRSEPTPEPSTVEVVLFPPKAKPDSKAPAKRKTREQELADEEKMNKLNANLKGKRRHRGREVEVEEEEDTEVNIDLLESEPTSEVPDEGNSTASMYLMRPPKPKSTTTPTTVKPNRPQTSRPRRGEPVSRTLDTAARTPSKPELLELTGSLTVQQLAEQLAVHDTEVIKTLFLKGKMVTVTQALDMATIELVCQELGVEVIIHTIEASSSARKETEMLEATDLDNLHHRPPVVTVMGHVDHGKTTLLDAIRKTRVAQGEAGGITQHIGAYHVDVPHEDSTKRIVFLDTPGHEAFTAMRARGAKVTDVAILVVAADDGVRPQTIEAIRHAQAAQVPIIVAINKIDKDGAQPDRVKTELMTYALVAEEYGGDTIMVPVSALKGHNLETLLEMIVLVSEVTDLYANPDRPAKGTVIEAHLDRARGPVATLLVQNGTLRVGDPLVAGAVFAKVRAMVNDQGQRLEAAPPSSAVEVWGLTEVPTAGDEFEVYGEEKQARALAQERAQLERTRQLTNRQISLGTFSQQAQEGKLKELNLILKADVQGSVEAIVNSLKQLPQQEVQLGILLSAPGEVTETDVDLAAASGAVIIGFNTTLASGARKAADIAGVDIREYNIIYKLLEDIQGAMEGLLEPELVEEPLGQAEVRAVFTLSKGVVAGCYVQSGKLQRNCHVRLHRGNQVVWQGTLESLRRVKDDVREVAAGYECGVSCSDFQAWQENDQIEAFLRVTQRRKLT